MPKTDALWKFTSISRRAIVSVFAAAACALLSGHGARPAAYPAAASPAEPRRKERLFIRHLKI
jgi:hypothetical protein